MHFRTWWEEKSRSLFVYSDVGGSNVGNQVTDLLREINFHREGKENMKGGSLTRFRPDSKQEGQGLKDILMDVLENTTAGGWEGLKRSYNPLKAPVNVASGVKKGFKRGLKRGLEKEIQRQASKRLKDIFGE
ncbi:hypothetical protein OS493_023672 [Desmophyllum pertusum]|uniref:Uncharacterized protein n=1 Tax=Desmophyllum pertusum TaxID=174260 RepID=A0A9X0CSB6_9CNID|nr:hypothetical protein OS493_023672 [Desmophyllum pertusum]